jgi:hypothetical protein
VPDFQQQVYINPAQAVAGDFASSNPMVYKLSGTGRMVANSAGVTVGKFAALLSDGTVQSVPTTAPTGGLSRIGFVHRENNAQITTFLASAGSTIQPGQPVALFGTGDFWVRADVVVASTRGTAILWDVTTGNTSLGGTPSATLIDTGWKLISESASVGSIVQISNTGA